MAALRFEAFDSRRHDASRFSCGQPALDRYIRELASQDVRRDVARVFVAPREAGAGIIGFYSLAGASVRKESFPAEHAKRLPHYPVPVALIGRLAVDRDAQGQGVGELLLMDAFARIHEASNTLAVQSIVVDAKDGTAAAFYRRYGFLPLTDAPMRQFLPLATVRRLIER